MRHFTTEAVLPNFHDSVSERKSPERGPRSQREPRVADGFREIDAVYFRDGEIGKDQFTIGIARNQPKRVQSALAQNRSIAKITKRLERTDTETVCPRTITQSPGGIKASDTTKTQQGQPNQKEKIRATPFVCRDPSEIPSRQWLHGKHFVRHFVSVTVAPSGVRVVKGVSEARAMGTGKTC
jgi:hypothetical protein